MTVTLIPYEVQFLHCRTAACSMIVQGRDEEESWQERGSLTCFQTPPPKGGKGCGDSPVILNHCESTGDEACG